MIWRLVGLLGFLYWTISTGAQVQSYEPELSDHQSWRIHSYAQDADLETSSIFVIDFESNGTAWMATSKGLYRYDGYRWDTFTKENNLPSNFVRCVTVSRNGDVLIGADMGAAVFRDGIIKPLGTLSNLAGPSIRRIVEDDDGTLWFCCDQYPNPSTSGGITRYKDGSWKSYDKNDGLPSSHVYDFYRDENGRPYALTFDGLALMQNERWKPAAESVPRTNIQVSTYSPLHGWLIVDRLQLHQRKEDNWQVHSLSFNCWALCTTQEGEVFTVAQTAADQAAFFRWDGTQFLQDSASFTAPLKYVEMIKEAPDGSIWAVGFGFIVRWDRKNREWLHYKTIPPPQFSDSLGRVWFTNQKETLRLDGDRWERLEPISGRMTLDRDGRVWSFDPNAITRWDDPQPLRFTPEETGIQQVEFFYFGVKNNLWLYGKDPQGKNLIKYYMEQQWRQLPDDHRLTRTILSCSADPVEGLWVIVTLNQSLEYQILHINTDGLHAISVPPHIFSFGHPGILADFSGGLYVYGHAGLFYSVNPELSNWTEIPLPGKNIVQCTLRGSEVWVVYDGSTGGGTGIASYSAGEWNEWKTDPITTYHQAQDGSLFFGAANRLYIVDPNQSKSIRELNWPPQSRIQSVVKDRNGYLWISSASDVLRYQPDGIAPDTVVELGYKRVFINEPFPVKTYGVERFHPRGESNRFLFSWQIDEGPWCIFKEFPQEGLTTYGLPVGRHVLRVRAQDEGMDTDESPAELPFEISPIPLQERYWFLPVVMTLFMILGILGIALLRARQLLAAHARNLELTVYDRTAELQSSELRFRTLVEHSPDFLTVVDVDSQNHIDANEIALRFFGYSRGEFMQFGPNEISPPIQADGRYTVDLVNEYLERASAGEPLTFEWIHYNAYGGEVPCEVRFVRLPAEGRRLVRCSIQDITLRKQAEQERLHYLWYVENLNQISECIEKKQDLNTMILHVVDKVLHIYDCDRVALLYPCDPKAPFCTAQVEVTKPEYPGLYELKENLKVTAPQSYMMEQALAGDTPVSFGPDHPLLGNEVFDRNHHIHSRLCTAIRPRIGSPWMLILHQCSHTREWSPIEKRLLQAIGSRITDALTNMLYFRNLQESEERHRTVVNQVNEIIFQMDTNGIWTFLNPAWKQITGFEIEETLHTHFTDYIHPEERQANQVAMYQLIEGLVEHVRMESRLITRSNEPRVVELYASRSNGSGGSQNNKVIVSGMMTDITERKKSEKEWTALQRLSQRLTGPLSTRGLGIVVASESRKLFEHDAFLLSLIDPIARKTTCVYAEDTGENDLAPEEVTLSTRSTFADWPETVINGQAQLINRQTENDPPDFTPFGFQGRGSLSIMYAPIRWQNQTIGILSIQSYHSYRYNQRDIDRLQTFADQCGGALKRVAIEQENMKLEEQLRQSQKMEAIGTLAGGVAHDFNNLLTVITGNCSLLLNKLTSEQSHYKYAQDIRKASERAAALTRQLLAFSRKQVQQTKVVNLNVVIQEIHSLISRIIGEDIQLITLQDPELGNIKGDSGQMEQVIMNLVVNSHDAMPNGGTIVIETRNMYFRQDTKQEKTPLLTGPYVQMTIRDNGAGIEKSVLPNIFNPFFTTKEQGKGTGLGLSTVYGIIKQCQGHIEVQSEVGVGTSVTVYLPRVYQQEEPETLTDLPVNRMAGRETLLLVEDEETVRTLMVDIISMNGYKVLSAGDGEEAQKISDDYSGPIDLLITDLMMPKISGKDLAEMFIHSGRILRILYISGYTEETIFHDKDESVIAMFLQKPFSPDELLNKIRTVLDSGNGK